MADKNPFNLEGRRAAGPDRAHVARDWTPEEVATKTAGYIDVPPDGWANVKNGTHVRYFTKEHGFRPGGFVVANPFDTKTRDGPEKRFIKLQNSFNSKARDYATWIVAYEDLTRLLIKLDTGTLLLQERQEDITARVNENIRKLSDYVKALEKRVAALER